MECREGDATATSLLTDLTRTAGHAEPTIATFVTTAKSAAVPIADRSLLTFAAAPLSGVTACA